MDVVPVYADQWTRPPFGAEIDQVGRIFARGAQDMKCVGLQYLAAIRQLKKLGISLQRTVHLSFVPDEEIGGVEGMLDFVKSKEFQALKVGFALDEGMASPTDTFLAFYAEKSLWQIKFKIHGNTGHAGFFHKETVGEKLLHIMDCLLGLRSSEEQRLEQQNLDVGEVTSINLTQIQSGVQYNVLPHLIEVVFDLRVANDVNLYSFEESLRQCCLEAGDHIEIEWLTRIDTAPATRHDMDDIYWAAFKRAIDKMDLKLEVRVFCGGTDAQYLRLAGIPAIGFSPINNTPVLLHDHDEFLDAETYLRGIDIYVKILEELGNVK